MRLKVIFNEEIDQLNRVKLKVSDNAPPKSAIKQSTLIQN